MDKYTDLIFLIISLSSVSWMYIYSTPMIIIRNWFIQKTKNWIPNLFIELIECLMCSTFWITFLTLLLGFSVNLSASFFGACIASLFITLLDGFIKIRL